jgi:hypothetical protein
MLAFTSVMFTACGCLDPWNVKHPGSDTYNNLDDMAKDFDAVYVVNPKTLNLSDEIGQVAIGISKSKYATIYVRYLTQFEKFDDDLLTRHATTDYRHNPGVRYILEANRVKFQYGWTQRLEGFPEHRITGEGVYTLTDKERYKK